MNTDITSKPINKLTSLTIFFPFLNDEGTVEQQIENAYKIGKEFANDLEVIAIIGGHSKDNTVEKIREMQKKHSDLVIVDKSDNTEGYAVIKYGFLKATKDWVFYTDGDAQYHIAEDFEKLFAKHVETNADVINGYKHHRGDTQVRVILGNAYKNVSKTLFKLPIRDTDCDFRLIKRSYLQNFELESKDASILPELIKRLEISGAKFAEVEVSHYSRIWGKSNYTPFSLFKEKLIGDLRLYFKMSSIQTAMINNTKGIDELINNHWWYKASKEIVLSILDRILKAKNLNILDVGCGTGIYTQTLQKYGTTQGIDVQEDMIELCKSKGLNCRVAKMQDIHGKTDKFDLITFFDSFSQIDKTDHNDVIKGVYDALNDGGLLLLKEPSLEAAKGNHDKCVNTRMRFNINYFEKLLTEHGFTIIYKSYLNMILTLPIILRRKIERKILNEAKTDLYSVSSYSNVILYNIFRLEKYIIRATKKLPVGTSVIIIARKN